jgi:diguanylate cyclase
MLTENDLPAKAQKIYQQITEVFAEQEINPTPLNYQIWYAYFKGDNPKFRQEMEAILADPFGYNDRTGKRLYNEYLKEAEAISELDRIFKRLVDAMIRRMTAWTERLEKDTHQLDDHVQSLNNPNIDPEQLKQITSSVRATTHTLRDQSREFQTELQKATEQIQMLRQQLIEARAETMKDELTELGNRKAFNLTLDELMAEVDVNNLPRSLVLIMTDIDHFKSFNDRFGHLVGDSVLRYFAGILRKKKINKQTLCRYGGEEFAIIMHSTDLEQAKAVAESIRVALENSHLRRKDTDEVLPPITASFGVAAYRPGESIEQLVKRADDLLYQAKSKGRNCVVTEGDD